jgi:hypothetical protein
MNSGGFIAQKGFRFQHIYSLYKLLKLHEVPDTYKECKATLEGLEDLDIDLTTETSNHTELYQIKSDNTLTDAKLVKIASQGKLKMESSKALKWFVIINANNPSKCTQGLNLDEEILINDLCNKKNHDFKNQFLLKSKILDNADKNNEEDNNDTLNNVLEKVIRNNFPHIKDYRVQNRNIVRESLMSDIVRKNSLSNTSKENTITKKDFLTKIQSSLESDIKKSAIWDELKEMLREKNLSTQIECYILYYKHFKAQSIQIYNNANLELLKKEMDRYLNDNQISNVFDFDTEVIFGSLDYYTRLNTHFDVQDYKMLFIEQFICKNRLLSD